MSIFSRKSNKEAEAAKENVDDNNAILDAIHRSMAVIEFTLDGHILTANENFLATVGYSLEDIQGNHHSMFCEEPYKSSREYKDFWQKLRSGRFISGEFKRVNSRGEVLWLEASYNPVKDSEGNTIKVVKFASNVTDKLLKAKETQSLINALNLSVAVIEFTLDGNVIHANNNFCGATGHRLEDIQGKHHRTFCKESYANSKDYSDFWDRLAKGEAFGGRFERVNAANEPLWLEATYNPIRDEEGKVYKVVKFASDITAAVIKQDEDSQSAIKAFELASETDLSAVEGSEVIHKAASEMTTISKAVSNSSVAITDLAEQSEQITNIVNTIRGIAEQTNLLALNAAIEAAPVSYTHLTLPTTPYV